MGAPKLVKINSIKLRNILYERKLDMKVVSEEIGYEQSFISKCISRGSLSNTAIKGLELRYGIHYDDIKAEEPKPQRVEPPAQQEIVNVEAIDYQKLFAVVYQAFKKALNE